MCNTVPTQKFTGQTDLSCVLSILTEDLQLSTPATVPTSPCENIVTLMSYFILISMALPFIPLVCFAGRIKMMSEEKLRYVL